MAHADAPVDEDARRRLEADRIAGGAAPVAAFLPAADAASYPGTLEELVAIDLEFRWKRWAAQGRRAADAPDLSPYAELLAPTHLADVRKRLAEEESRLRERHLDPQTPHAGRRVAHYVLVARAGRGASSEVWRARDERLRRDVALKFARAELAGDAQVVARLLREAQSAARLRHPGIVPVHEVGEWEGQPYVVSDFVEGPTLAQAMARRRFPPEDAARLVADVANALDYAHACGVVHRDVKPGNVLLDAAGRPLLADFGLAQLGASEAVLTRHGDVVGTPAYLPPERARGDGGETDLRGDVYSLGVVLYELLTGARPFERPTWEGLLFAVVHEEPPPPRARTPDLPADLETICLKAMAKEPARRYASARALEEDLRRWLARRPILARPVRRGERAVLWVRRNPALAATVAASAAAVLVIGGVALHRVLDERRRFRAERDRANGELYRALVTEARAHLASHDSEWRDRATQALRQAATLDAAERDRAALRDLALACMGSLHPSFRRVGTWAAGGAPAARLVASPRGTRVAEVGDDGSVRVRAHPGGETVGLAAFGEPRAACAAFVAEDRLVVGFSDGAVALLDAATLTGARDTSRKAAVTALAVAPSGDVVAVGREDGLAETRPIDAAGARVGAASDVPGHEGAVLAVAFSPDGRALATAGADRWIRVRDLAGRRLDASHRASDPPRALSFSPGGTHVAWCTWESGGWGLLRLTSSERVQDWNGVHLAPVRSVAWLSEERVLTASADGTLRVFSARYGELLAVARPGEGPVRAAALAGDPTRIAAAHESGAVTLWELTEPRERTPLRVPHVARFVPGTTRLVTGVGAVDFLPDGGTEARPLAVPAVRAVAATEEGLVACARADGSVILWTADGAPPRAVASAVPGTADAWAAARLGSAPAARTAPRAHEGDLVATEGPGFGIDLHLARDGTRLRTLEGHAARVTALEFADRTRLLSAGADRSLRVWDVDRGVARTLTTSGRTPPAWIAVGEGVAACGGDGWADVFDLGSLTPLLRLDAGNSSCGAFGRGGDLLVGTREGAVLAWDRGAFAVARAEDAAGGAEPARTSRPPDRVLLAGAHRAQVWGVAASADGRLVVTTSHDGEVKLWDAATLALLRDLPGGRGIAWCAAFSRDGRRVAAGVGETVVLAGAGAAGTADPVRLTGHEAIVSAVAFHPAVPVAASSSADGTLRLWDAGGGRALGVLHRGDAALHDLAFSPDGRALLVASADGGMLVWDEADRLASAALTGGAAPTPPTRRVAVDGSAAWAVGFDARGELVALGTQGGTVALLDARTWRPLARLTGDFRLVRSLSFDDAGRFLAVGCYNSASVVWDLPAVRRSLAPLGLDW